MSTPCCTASWRRRRCPGSGVEEDVFWAGLADALAELAPRQRDLLARRDELQRQLDTWHGEHPGAATGAQREEYEAFLREIGYLVEAPDSVEVTTSGVDPEVGSVAGPQLVVPLLNARFATNAANARWGSLYDALYGSDVIDTDDGKEPGTSYNPIRGAAVVARAKEFLDESVPLEGASHADASGYAVDDDGLAVTVDGEVRRLAEPDQLVGYRGEASAPEAVVLRPPRPARGDPGRPRGRDRRRRRRRRQGRGRRGRGHHDHGPRGLGRRRRRRGQGPGLPQLAPADAGRAEAGGHQGRDDLHPRRCTPTAPAPRPTAAR